MLEKKKEYINQLLSDIKSLEERLLAVKDNDAVPFSFFRESFNKTQEIMRLLHELEILQIDDMKRQMERLVLFLSESESRKQPIEPVQPLSETIEPVSAVPHNEFVLSEEVPPEEASPRRNEYADGILLPEYKNPRMTETPPPVIAKESPLPEMQEEQPVIRSLNDMVKAPDAKLDLKHSISLNDRFLYQRELFNNDRHEMNSMMLRLNAFDNYADAEQYLRENTSWNFKDETVKDFLLAIRKGWE